MSSQVEFPKEEIKKWSEALRSGEYSQTRARLQDDKGFCCLGVGCQIFSPKHKRDKEGHLVGGWPGEFFDDPAWLSRINSDFSGQLGVSLSKLNDDGTDGLDCFAFDEIADLLEAVYIHEVLS